MSKRIFHNEATVVEDVISSMISMNMDIRRLGHLNVLLHKDMAATRDSQVSILTGAFYWCGDGILISGEYGLLILDDIHIQAAVQDMNLHTLDTLVKGC